ncbi:hypothetical protein SAMN00120144_1713 [Hymenobacter roseosalivarius DSM 11622]|uniref:Uncharacterized protein n=1 Tax=Hymenobacter roseosalivarius DSM 11622 TaxID=645990 RepID=A0A1W1W448_9BACT|nr:hypothetical protein [Hymenobacter roseosalivarius]SMC00283.1 hypothetical protein SAMN00120144_1713 [Hymenobacter roseosalivarius DSM 11622]
MQLELLAVDKHATNTAYRYTGPWSLKSPGEDFKLESRYLKLREGDQPNLVSVGVNARGPGLMLRIGPLTIGSNNLQALFEKVAPTAPTLMLSFRYWLGLINGIRRRKKPRCQPKK